MRLLIPESLQAQEALAQKVMSDTLPERPTDTNPGSVWAISDITERIANPVQRALSYHFLSRIRNLYPGLSIVLAEQWLSGMDLNEYLREVIEYVDSRTESKTGD